MCLILFALNAHPQYKFVLAANRDEFYARPTARAEFWADAPQTLAGRDLAAGGTWLGITRTGRFAAVTNYRDPTALVGEKSRGDLTKNFLIGDESPESYLQKIEREKNKYSGFNLLVSDFSAGESDLFYFSNRGGKTDKLRRGIYGLSNAFLNTNWLKVEKGKAKFSRILENNSKISLAPLFQVLADREIALDEKLPATGVGIERERVLSPAFIETENYGTRLSTVLTIGRDNRVRFVEKTFVGAAGAVEFDFAIKKSAVS